MSQSGTSLNGEGSDSRARVTEQAKQVAQDLKDKASTVAESVTAAAKEETAAIESAAKEVLDEATDKLRSAVSEQKAAGADYLDTVSRAIQRAAGEFETDVPVAAQYLRRAGSQLGDVAEAVRHRDMRELVTEVEDFARRQPTLFFGGALLFGFAAVRFLKSSPSGSGAESPVRSGQSGRTN